MQSEGKGLCYFQDGSFECRRSNIKRWVSEDAPEEALGELVQANDMIQALLARWQEAARAFELARNRPQVPDCCHSPIIWKAS